MSSPRWHWLDDGLLPPLLAAVRTAWIWPWLELLRRWLTPASPLPWIPLWAIPLFLLAATWTAHLALTRTDSLRRARAGVIAVGLLVLLGVLWGQYARATYAWWDVNWVYAVAQALTHPDVDPLPLFTLLIGAGLWLRGVVEGSERLIHENVWRAFVTGLAALALLLLAAQFDPRGLPPGTEGWLLLAIAAGLAALALSSLQLARITGRWQADGDSQLPLNRYWLASVTVVIGGMLAVGLAVGAVVSPGAVARALSWVTVVLEWVGTILAYLLLAISYVIFLILTPLYEWIRAHIPTPRPLEPLTMGNQEQTNPFSDLTTSALPPEWAETVRWLGLAGVLIVVGVAVALALRYFRRSDEDGVEETRETIFTQSLLEEQLAALWDNLRRRLRRTVTADPSPYLSLAEEQENRQTIRRLYQTVLTLAKAQGHPRSPWQTPAEYMAQLAAGYPAAGEAWTAAAEEYVAARYGRQAPTPAQVERMHWACAEIQRLLAPESPPLPPAAAETPPA